MGKAKEVDYETVLADLRAKRAELDAAIAAVSRLLGKNPQTAIVTPKGGEEKKQGSEITSDTFFGLSVTEASKKYLRLLKKPQGTQVICDALTKGGLLTNAKHFYANVYTAMMRDNDFVKVKRGQWGLAEWYPGRAKAAGSNNVKAKIKRKTKRRKVKKVTTKDTPES